VCFIFPPKNRGRESNPLTIGGWSFFLYTFRTAGALE
jgi:hypothetical protein